MALLIKIVPTSKAQANQRAGRAGRESAGKCFRLYPEEVFEDLEDITLPEIQRVDIAQVILQVRAIQRRSLVITVAFLC
jgi:HrpA-like RNA helicase